VGSSVLCTNIRRWYGQAAEGSSSRPPGGESQRQRERGRERRDGGRGGIDPKFLLIFYSICPLLSVTRAGVRKREEPIIKSLINNQSI